MKDGKKNIYQRRKTIHFREVSEHRLKYILEKHKIFPASYYSWIRKFEEMGEDGFIHGITPVQLKRIRELEKENKMIKELIVDKELESKLKDELLKKKYALEKKRK